MGKYFDYDLIGKKHGFLITGDTPSPDEAVRIKQKIDSANASYGLTPTEPQVEASLGSDIVQSGKAGIGDVIAGAGWLTGAESVEEYGKGVREAAEAKLSTEQKEAEEKGITGGGGLRALAGGVARSVPSFVATIPATAAAAYALPATAAAGIGAIGLRVLGAVAPKVAAKANPVAIGRNIAGMLAGGGSEGLTAAGMSGSEIQQTVEQLAKDSPDIFENSPLGKKYLLQTGGDVAAAAKLAGQEVAGDTALKTGLSTAALALPGASFEARVLIGGAKRGLVKEALTGIGVEAGQEAPQSAAEQAIRNVELQDVDTRVRAMDGVLKAGIEGGIIGGVIGGAFGGAGAIGRSKENAQETVDDLKAHALELSVENELHLRNLRSSRAKYELPTPQLVHYRKKFETPLLPAPEWMNQAKRGNIRPPVYTADPMEAAVGLQKETFTPEPLAISADKTDNFYVTGHQSKHTYMGPFKTRDKAEEAIGHYSKLTEDSGNAKYAEELREYQKKSKIQKQAAKREYELGGSRQFSTEELPMGARLRLHTFRSTAETLGDTRGLASAVDHPSTSVDELRRAGVVDDVITDLVATQSQVTGGKEKIQEPVEPPTRAEAVEAAGPEIKYQLWKRTRATTVKDKDGNTQTMPQTERYIAPASAQTYETREEAEAALGKTKTKTKPDEFVEVRPLHAQVQVSSLESGKQVEQPEELVPSRTVDEAEQKELIEQAKRRPSGREYKKAMSPLRMQLRAQLNKYGLGDALLELHNEVASPDEKIAIEGVSTTRRDPKKDGLLNLIQLSTGIYDPKATPQQLINKLMDVMNHEIIHALLNMGVITDDEMNLLRRYVASRPYVDVSGRVRKFNYLQRAQMMYHQLYSADRILEKFPTEVEAKIAKMGLDGANPEHRRQAAIKVSEDFIYEEAIAEAFRGWARKPNVVTGKPSSLFRKIVEFFKTLFKSRDTARKEGVEDFFKQIIDGDIANRSGSVISPAGEKFSASYDAEKMGAIDFGKRTTRVIMRPGIHRKDPKSNAESGFGLVHASRHLPEITRDTGIRTINDFVKTILSAKDKRLVQRDDGLRVKLKLPHWKSTGVVALGNTMDEGKPALEVITTFVEDSQPENRVFTAEEAKREMDRLRQERQPRYSMMYSGGLTLEADAVRPMSLPEVNMREYNIAYGAAYDLIHKGVSFASLGKINQHQVDDFMYRFQDKLIGLGRLVDFANTKGHVGDLFDVMMRAQLYSGRSGERLQLAERSLYRPFYEEINAVGFTKADVVSLAAVNEDAAKMVAKFDKTGIGVTMIGALMYARHAPERNAVIYHQTGGKLHMGSGMKSSSAKAIREWFKAHPKYQAANSAAKKGYDIIVDTNKTRVAGELTMDFESAETAKVFTDAGLPEGYKWYVPLRDWLEEDPDHDRETAEFVKGTGAGFSTFGKEDKTPTGRSAMVTKRNEFGQEVTEELGTLASNVIPHLILQHEMSIIRAEKNYVAQTLYKLVSDPQFGLEQDVTVLHKAPTRRAVVNGRIKDVGDMTYKQRDDIVIAKMKNDKGEIEEAIIQVRDPRIARSLKGADGTRTSTAASVVQAIGLVTQKMGQLATSWNPEFMLSNMPADVMNALVQVHGSEGAATMDIMRGLRGSIKSIYQVTRGKDGGADGQHYRDMKLAGGTTEFMGLRDLNKVHESINKSLSGMGNKQVGAVKQGLKSLGDFIENLNTVAENATRLQIYKAMLKAGYSQDRAAQAAKNVTVNFNQGGEHRNFINSFYMFFNASMQGSFAMVNAFTRSKKVQKIFAGIIVAGFMQDMMNGLMSDEDDDGEKVYDKIPEYILEHNLVVMDPLGVSDRGYFKLRLPYGLGGLYNFGRAMARASRGAYTPGEAAMSSLGTMLSSFNPVGGAQNFANFVAPTVIDPIIDMFVTNKDFTGREIYPSQKSFGPEQPRSLLYWNNVSPIAKTLSQALHQIGGGTDVMPAAGVLEWSPNQIEYAFEAVTGAAGAFALRVGQFPFLGLKDLASGEGSIFEMNDVPLARKLLGNVSTRQDVAKFSDNREEALMILKEYEDALEKGDGARMRKVMKQHGPTLRYARQLKRINGERNKVLQKIREIERNDRMPEGYKTKMIQSLNEQSDHLVGRANRLAID